MLIFFHFSSHILIPQLKLNSFKNQNQLELISEKDTRETKNVKQICLAFG